MISQLDIFGRGTKSMKGRQKSESKLHQFLQQSSRLKDALRSDKFSVYVKKIKLKDDKTGRKNYGQFSR